MPVFVAVYFNVSHTGGLIVYLLASITDWLDGFIARRYNLVSKWGKLMDPLADKVMTITALIVLVQSGILPIPIIIFVALKELAQMIAAFIVLRRKDIVIPANWTGKVATVLFTVGIALSFMGGYVQTAGFMIILTAVLLSIVALARYTFIGIPQYFRKEEE